MTKEHVYDLQSVELMVNRQDDANKCKIPSSVYIIYTYTD